MRILILGAGQVGASVAEALSSEANDITIIDQNRESLAQLADHLDVRTLTGNAAYPSVLKEAGIEGPDQPGGLQDCPQPVQCHHAHCAPAIPRLS